MYISGKVILECSICNKKEAAVIELVLSSRDLSSILVHSVYNMQIKQKT